MPRLNPQFEVVPLSRSINHYFELSIYLLVLTGFATLASTGGLDLATIVLAAAALALRGYLLGKRRKFIVSKSWTTPLTIAYFIFYAADYLVLSRNFLMATVHLVLFAVVVRTFSVRRDRDYITLAILAFLMVLASAVLTVDSIFLFFFAGFMLMAVTTFILMEMKRSAHAASFQARHSSDEKEHRHLAFSLARTTPALGFMILLGAAAIFFILPRMSTGHLGGYSYGTDFSTGFSDRVQLGGIGQIQQSDAIVMHIKIDGDQGGQYLLHWRGVALANFDGRSWSNPHQPFVLQRGMDGSFIVPPFGQGVQQASTTQLRRIASRSDHVIHYRVLMEPIGTNVFFLAPWARRVNGGYRALEIDSSGAVTDLDSQRPVSTYEADSDISIPATAALETASDSIPPFVEADLQLPHLDPRIPQLAQQITASASNNYDRATALEKYLKTHYGYTLQLPRTFVVDPLANFLFERKQGHCEYFASAMAVMLRALHIPARVVNGFRGAEFNDVTGNYVIRAKDAHAWVEAYFPGYGWVTFDPTPGGAVNSPQGWGRAALYLDAAASFWREWVVSYDSSHQYILSHSVITGTRGFSERAHMWARLRYARLLNWARRGQQGLDHSPQRWLVGSIAIAVLLFVLANVSRIAHAIRSRNLRAHPERSPDATAAMWYGRMTQSLARRGMQKSKTQTPQEFVHNIEDERLRKQVKRFTQAYESARFGNSSEDALQLGELYEEVELANRR